MNSDALHRAIAGAFLFAAVVPALALTPTEVFEQASPSVWAVRALDDQERPFSYGSAVVVAPGQLVTNCHVLAKAKAIQLRRDNVLYEAKLEHADVERDLCVLSAKNFNAPAVTVAKIDGLKVGQRVFAIGNPQRLALTLSEGLISGLRGEEDKPLIQTTAPLSPGSSGGGLFDEGGRLVGITTFGVVNLQRTTQSLNFALPAEWIADVAERTKLRTPVEPAANAAPAAVKQIAGYPAIGATWKYGFRDRQYSSPERIFTVRVIDAKAGQVRESFAVDREEERTLTVDPDAIQFAARRLSGDYSVIELAPYFFSSARAEPGTPVRPARYPNAQWDIDIARMQPEDITVPAGTYKAIRLDVTGTIVGGASQHFYNASIPVRFHYTAWYAPAVNRYVMVRNQTWNSRDLRMGDEVSQLLEYRPK